MKKFIAMIMVVAMMFAIAIPMSAEVSPKPMARWWDDRRLNTAGLTLLSLYVKNYQSATETEKFF